MRVQVSLSLIAVAIAGCVSTTSPVSLTAPPSATSSYIAGRFEKKTSVHFGFRITDQESPRSYVLEFADDQASMIAVPPGTYHVSTWLTWRMGEKTSEKTLAGRHVLNRTFTVEPGQVMLLGRWTADSSNFSHHFEIDATPTTLEDEVDAFHQAYPLFDKQQVSCLICEP